MRACGGWEGAATDSSLKSAAFGRARQICSRISASVASISSAAPVAERLVRLGRIVGKGRLLAGTDCALDTFIHFTQVDPDFAWLTLKSLPEGAELASAES